MNIRKLYVQLNIECFRIMGKALERLGQIVEDEEAEKVGAALQGEEALNIITVWVEQYRLPTSWDILKANRALGVWSLEELEDVIQQAMEA